MQANKESSERVKAAVREVLERDLAAVKERGALRSTAFSDVGVRSEYQNEIRAKANEWFAEEYERKVKAGEKRVAAYTSSLI